MSENEEIMNETENETMAAEVEAVETVETEAAEVEAADEVSAEEEAEVVEATGDYDDEELMDKMQKAARLLRSRRFAISKEEEAKAERMANIERAIKLLDLKPKMEQKEMSDLLGMRLRELDGLMAEAEAADLVGRVPDSVVHGLGKAAHQAGPQQKACGRQQPRRACREPPRRELGQKVHLDLGKNGRVPVRNIPGLAHGQHEQGQRGAAVGPQKAQCRPFPSGGPVQGRIY